MHEIIGLLIPSVLLFLLSVYAVYLRYDYTKFKKKVVHSFDHRIHVNGIRGKSSVTRLIAGVLREAGIMTIAKTTGSAARIIDEKGRDKVIKRKEANIAEQREILEKYSDQKYQAAVFECMAVKPEYAEFLEQKIMHSTILVITNVRHDHMDDLGETIEEIAESLARSIPFNGTVITAETSKKALAVLKKRAEEKNSKLVVVRKSRVSIAEINQFNHFELRENVAIALEIAKQLKIDRAVALRGMLKVKPDPGAFKLQKKRVLGKNITWANLFAANDSDSFLKLVDLITKKEEIKNIKKAIILNNRQDRPERVVQFAEIAKKHKAIDYVFTFGDYESDVENVINNTKKIYKFGNSSEDKNSNGEVLLKKMSSKIPDKDFLLIGAVNIHTNQAEAIKHYLSA